LTWFCFWLYGILGNNDAGVLGDESDFIEFCRIVRENVSVVHEMSQAVHGMSSRA
jgi:hypothetical protein